MKGVVRNYYGNGEMGFRYYSLNNESLVYWESWWPNGEQWEKEYRLL